MLQAYMLCDSMATCIGLRRNGVAAMYRHPAFFPHQSCMRPLVGNYSPGGPCDTRRLYLHYLCWSGWEDRKARSWTENDLWMIDEDLRPMWQDGGGPKGPHAFMPCFDQLAWPDVKGNLARRRRMR